MMRFIGLLFLASLWHLVESQVRAKQGSAFFRSRVEDNLDGARVASCIVPAISSLNRFFFSVYLFFLIRLFCSAKILRMKLGAALLAQAPKASIGLLFLLIPTNLKLKWLQPNQIFVALSMARP